MKTMKSTAKLIGSLIRHYDGYGSPVSLLIDGESEVKNVFGGLITLITLFLSLFLSKDCFFDLINHTNPTTTTNIEYNIENSNFNMSSFFMALSFYSPKDNSIIIHNKYNDKNKTFYMNNLTYICTNCNQTSSTLLDGYDVRMRDMNLCNEKTFKDKSIKGLSYNKSDGILSIFRNYSYCFPDGIQGKILNNIDSNNTKVPEASIQIFIPRSNTPVDFTKVIKNTITQKSFIPKTPKTINSIDQQQTFSTSGTNNLEQSQTKSPNEIDSSGENNNSQPTNSEEKELKSETSQNSTNETPQSQSTTSNTSYPTPTTTISTNSFSNTNSSTPSPVQQPIFSLIQNPSSSKPNIIRKTKSKTDM